MGSNKLSLQAIVTGALLAASSLAQAVIAVEPEPELINPTKPAFYVVETATAYGGAYTIHNNTMNMRLFAFGVTNPSSSAVAAIDGVQGGGFVNYSNGNDYELWGALNLNASNWNEEILWDFSISMPASAQALYGDITTVLGAYGNSNYFGVVDANLLDPGLSAWDFGFLNAVPASSLFGAALDENDNLYTFHSVAVVPEPETYALLLAGLVLVGAAARRRAARA